MDINGQSVDAYINRVYNRVLLRMPTSREGQTMKDFYQTLMEIPGAKTRSGLGRTHLLHGARKHKASFTESEQVMADANWHRRQVLKGLAGTALAASMPRIAHAQAAPDPKFLIVVGAAGGASIIDAMLGIKASECADAANLNTFPDSAIVRVKTHLSCRGLRNRRSRCGDSIQLQ